MVALLDDTSRPKRGKHVNGNSWRRDTPGPPFAGNCLRASRFLSLSLAPQALQECCAESFMGFPGAPIPLQLPSVRLALSGSPPCSEDLDTNPEGRCPTPEQYRLACLPKGHDPSTLWQNVRISAAGNVDDLESKTFAPPRTKTAETALAHDSAHRLLEAGQFAQPPTVRLHSCASAPFFAPVPPHPFPATASPPRKPSSLSTQPLAGSSRTDGIALGALNSPLLYTFIYTGCASSRRWNSSYRAAGSWNRTV